MEVSENSNKYRRLKRALFGDKTGKIRTFAIISPQNPLGWKDSTEDEFREKFIEWTSNKNKYNKKALKSMKTSILKNVIEDTGEKTLRMGNFDFIPIKGSYGDKEKSLLILNLPFADAKILARNFGQESFFYGKNKGDKNSEIAYYKTDNACKSYKLVEITDTISDQEEAEDFFSKFGLKFSIDMQEFGADVKPVINDGSFEESFNEDRNFMSRASQRKKAYLEEKTDESQEILDEINKFIDDIYLLRKTSIMTDGEYGKGNMVFKEIRNNGYLDKLKELKVKLTEKDMIVEKKE